MEVSVMVENMPTNPIRFLTPLVEKREKKGINFFKINIGQPDVFTDESILKELKRFVTEGDLDVLKYTSAKGLYETREAWANGYYEGMVSPEGVIVTNGSSEAMMLMYLALLNEGEANLVFSPIYPNYIAYAHITGRNVVSVPRSASDGYKLPTVDDIEQVIRQNSNVKMLTIISPDNPTGAVLTREDIEHLYELAEKYDLWVIVDEAYRDIRFDSSTVVVSDIVRDNPNWMARSFFLATLSKEFSACGLRLGAIASTNIGAIGNIVKLVRPRLSVNELAQRAAIPALNNPRFDREVVRDIYRKRRDIVVSKFRELGLDIVEPQGALYILPDLELLGITDAFDFARWMVKEFTMDINGEPYSVVVTPGSGFYPEGDPNKKDSLIRIAYVLDEEKLKQAMEVLAAGIKEYVAQKSGK